MGGDFAPDAVVEGAAEALGHLSPGERLVLIGDESLIKEKLGSLGLSPAEFDMVPTTQVIGMSDHPAKAFSQKRDSSIAVGYAMLKGGMIDGFASAGNTGAMMIGAHYTVNVIPGVIRPALAALIPNVSGGSSVMLDVGINPDSKPDALLQYGMLGTVYARYVLGIESPTVGLLNIGREEGKGSAAAKAAWELLNEANDIDFRGNIEGHHLFTDDMTDVIVCDGFVGNVVLKMAEKLYVVTKARGIKDSFLDRLNFEVVGGTPVVGINDNVVVGHGISKKTAIRNMILTTRDVIRADLAGKIREAFEK